MSKDKKDVIQSINERLDATAVLQAIDYRWDKSVSLGGAIKTPCMIHRDERFATLLVFPKKNTCRCLIATCQAHEECTLVELYALYTGKPPLEAALEAAERTGLILDPNLREKLIFQHLEEAQQALEGEDIEKALDCLEEARKAAPEDPEVVLLEAQIAQHQEKSAEAVAKYLEAARQFRDSGKAASARDALRDGALRLEPANPEAKAELGYAYKDLGSEVESLEALAESTKLFEAAGRLPETLPIFEDLSSAMIDSITLRMRYARALEASGDMAHAVSTLQQISREMPEEELEARAQVLTHLRELAPSDHESRRRLAQTLAALKRDVEAVSELTTLGDEDLAAGRVEEAMQEFQAALALESESVVAHEGLAAVFREKGLHSEELHERLEVARLYESLGLADKVVEHLEAACELEPENGDLKLRLAKASAAEGDSARGAVLRREAIPLLYRAQETEKARETLESLATEGEDVLTICAIAFESGDSEHAEAMIRRDARNLMASGKADEALKLAEEASAAHPGSEKLLAVVGRAAIASDKIDRAREIVELLTEKEAKKEALELLGAAVDRFPDEGGLRERLVELQLSDGVDAAGREAISAQAQAWAKEGRRGDAIRCFRKLAALEEGSREAQNRLLELLSEEEEAAGLHRELIALVKMEEERGNRTRALELIEAARHEVMKPDDRLVLLTLEADILEKTGEKEQAGLCLLRAAELEAMKQDLEAAREKLSHAADLCPERPEIILAHAECLAELEQAEEAAGEYRRAARTFAAGSDPIQAKPLYDRLVDDHPGDVELLVEYAQFLESIGARESAAEMHLRLAQACHERDQEAQSVEHLKSAASMTPASLALRKKIFETMVERGHREEAVADARQAAEAFLAKPDPQAAREFLERALEIAPDDLALLREDVRAAIASGEEEAAVSRLKRLIELVSSGGDTSRVEGLWREVLDLAPRDSQAREELGRLLIVREGVASEEGAELLQAALGSYREAQNSERSAAVLSDLLRAMPEKVEFREELAALYEEQGRRQEAAENYVSAARMRREAGESAQAMALYEKTTELQPENTDALADLIAVCGEAGDTARAATYAMRLATVFDAIGATGDAIRVCDEGLEADADSIDLRVMKATLLLKEDQKAEGLECYIQAAELLAAAEETERARDVLGRIEKLAPAEQEAHNRIGNVYVQLGNETEGLAHWMQGLRTYFGRGEYDAAEQLSDRLREYLPRDSDLAELRAQVFEAAGKTEKAVSELEALLVSAPAGSEQAIRLLDRMASLQPGRAELLDQLIDALVSGGRQEEAAERMLTRAQEALEQDNADGAQTLAERAVELNPMSVDARQLLAEALARTGDTEKEVEQISWLSASALSSGDYERAKAHLERGKAIAPESVELLMRSAEVLELLGSHREAVDEYLEAAEAAKAAGREAEQIRALEKASRTCPADTRTHGIIAERLLEAGHSDRSLEEFMKVIALNIEQGLIEDARQLTERIYRDHGKHASIRERVAEVYRSHDIPELAAQEYFAIARVAFEGGDHENTRQWCEKILEFKPRDVEARELLAKALLAAGQKERAKELFEELAGLFLESNSHEHAVNALRTLVEMEPSNLERGEQFARELESTGQTEEAAKELERLAEAYRTAGKAEKAARLLDSLIQLRPDDTRARIGFIHLHAEIGNQAEALPVIFELAEIYRKQGAFEEATRLLEQAVNLDPTDQKIRGQYIDLLLEYQKEEKALSQTETLVEQLCEKGEYGKANKFLQKVAAIGEENPDYHLARANVLTGQNQKGKALQALEKACELYEQTGDVENHTAAISLALQVDKQNIEFHRQLIGLLEKQERKEEALSQRLELAQALEERGLLDIAASELRAVTREEPGNEKAWERLFDVLNQTSSDRGPIEDYLTYAGVRLAEKDWNATLEFTSRVIREEPHNIRARELYIEAYLNVGHEVDLCEDYLALADLYISDNRIDEGIELYDKVTAIDPVNTKARERLTETQARRSGQKVPKPSLDDLPTERPHETKARRSTPASGAGGQNEAGDTAARNAAAFLAAEMSEMDDEDENEGLQQVIQNYLDILSVNPNNANVRIKLADIYERLEKEEEMLEELRKASESLFQKGELGTCITVCERILGKQPTDQKVRIRLKQAFNKRDAFKALESAILFTDRVLDDDTDSSTRNPGT